MDPKLSKTLLNLLGGVPGAEALPQRFPLLFPNVQSSVSQQQANHDTGREESCTTKVGTQVNVITGGSSGVGQLNVKSPDAVVAQASKSLDTFDIPIKVINPSNKRESKTYMLSLQLEKMATLKCLREHILDQLGKGVVKFNLQFDVGYFSGTHKICFVENDSIGTELKCLHEKGKSLWCDGYSPKSRTSSIVCIDSDSDEEPPVKRAKLKEKKPSALESKTQRVDSLANELGEKHGKRFSKIQYKLWVEALDVGKHQSKEEPPRGPIWGDQKTTKNTKKGTDSVDAMASAFTHMANTVATALSPPEKAQTPTKPPSHLSHSEVGISPGRRIELQEKLFKQIDMLHKMYERGAITGSQFESRRESLLTQMDKLAE